MGLPANAIPVLACPACDSTDSTFWLRARGFDLVRCSSCSHRYATAIFSEHLLANQYYDEPDRDLAARTLAAKTLRFAEYIGLLRARHPTPGRVLDVGCNSGELLQLFQGAGWQVAGIEVSAGPANYARRALRAPVWQGRVEDVLPDAEQFDVITIVHVLEHIRKPRLLLERLRTALRPGGTLVVEVPNANDALLRFWRGMYRPLCPGDHISFFDANSLARIMQASGFAVAQLDSPLHSRDVIYPCLLSAVDTMRQLRRRPEAGSLDGVCGQMRYRGKLRRPLRNLLDDVASASDPLVVSLSRNVRRRHKGPVLIAAGHSVS